MTNYLNLLYHAGTIIYLLKQPEASFCLHIKRIGLHYILKSIECLQLFEITCDNS